jgi:hypothetical protein
MWIMVSLSFGFVVIRMIHIGNGNCVVIPITNIIKLKLEKSNQNVITDLERAGIFE